MKLNCNLCIPLAESANRDTLPGTMKTLFAEFLGTFTLVFAGTGAIVVNAGSGGQIGHAGVALTFGLVVMVMIYCFGDVSGAHLNPAVTVAFAAARRFPWRDVLGYLAAQIAGALTASGLIWLLFSAKTNESFDPHGAAPWLGATLPSGAPWQSFIFEIVLTFILMVVILNVSTGAKEKGITAGIAVGGTIAFEAMFAGIICGASMNPARSLAPALVSGNVAHLWIYLIAPVIGALLAVPVVCYVRPDDCCPASDEPFTKAA